MTDEAARPEPAGSLTRAELNLPSGNVGKLVEEMRSHAGLTAQTQTDLLLNQAADLLISQQGEIERLKTIAGLALNPEAPEFMAAEWRERATKAEALLVKAREALAPFAAMADALEDWQGVPEEAVFSRLLKTTRTKSGLREHHYVRLMVQHFRAALLALNEPIL